jgi:hypothetical protein
MDGATGAQFGRSGDKLRDTHQIAVYENDGVSRKAQTHPIVSVPQRGMDKKKGAASSLTLQPARHGGSAQLICPSGKLPAARKTLSTPSAKNKSLRDLLKSAVRLSLSRLIRATVLEVDR